MTVIVTSATLAFIPIARPTFDIPLATEVTAQVRGQLEAAGLTLRGPDTLVSSLAAAEDAAQALSEMPLDLLLVFQSTFADSTMVLRLAQMVDVPLLLWAIPEAPTGGRLRLNSLCGVNLAGHALTRAGIYYDTVYAQPDDPAALEKVRAIAQAGRAKRVLNGARIGRLGEHPDGFDTCRVSYAKLQDTFGVDVVQLDLETTFDEIRAMEPHKAESVLRELDTQVAALSQVDQAALRGTLNTYTRLRELAQERRLSGFAVRCWPEFFTGLGCAACGALSLLNDDMTPAACEADVNGAITQLILQALSGEAAFGNDIVSFDMEQNTAVFWHCGKAPLAMADPAVAPRATIHSNRQLPLLMEFPLKPGVVTLARLSEATGEFRLVVGRGEVVQAPISFTGTSGVVRFENPARDVLDTILGAGLEHHLALTYGDHVDALLALARMLKIPVLRL